MKTQLRYPLLVVLSAVMYGIAPALTQLSYDYGGNGMTLSVLIPLFAIPCFFLLAKREKQSFHLEEGKGKQIVLMATLGSGAAMILLFFSYEFISAGMATSLHFVYPILVAFALVLFFKEKLNAWKIAALLVAVAGIVVISLDDLSGNLIGIVLAVLSGVAWAFNIIYLDKSGLNRMNAYVLSFYSSVLNLGLALVVGLLTRQLVWITSPIAWAAAIGAAVIGRVIALPCFQIGIRGTGSLTAGILSTFEPITSVLIGILLFADTATGNKIAGCLLVVLGVCLIVYSDSKKSVEGEQAA